MGQQLGAGLVQAPLREPGVIGTSVDLQHVLQAPDKLSVGFGGDDPLLPQPGLEPVFLSTQRTVSYDSESTCSSSTIQLANSRRVQRPCPSGGALQATATRWASWRPSSFRWYWRVGGGPGHAAFRPFSVQRRRGPG